MKELIQIPIFDVDIYLYVKPSITDAALDVDRDFDLNNSLVDELKPSTVALSTKIITEDNKVVFVMLFELNKGCNSFFITHESLHIAWYILDEMKFTINVDDHEILAYLQGFIISEINKLIKKI